jgi:hypothetical protein
MNEFEIITHIHTDASSGAASALDLLVTESIRSVLGPDYESRWKECFNRPEDLCATLRPMGPVSMVFLTDHINEKYHRHSPDALELAARDERVAVGAEIQTFYRDGPASSACPRRTWTSSFASAAWTRRAGPTSARCATTAS